MVAPSRGAAMQAIGYLLLAAPFLFLACTLVLAWLTRHEVTVDDRDA